MNILDLNVKPTQFKDILVGVDESEQGYFALTNAVHQAREDDANLIIATVLELGDLSTMQAMNLSVIKEKRAELEANLQRYQDYAQKQGVKNVQVRFADGGKAGDVLVNDVAPAVHADLIVVGAHSHPDFWDSLGSQAAYIARYAKVSTMVVRKK